ncbi:MAG: deoxyguanosinetriphosphate triphosphohydrolase [Candidatus Paceibacter sp.]|jgi:dGTPase|nr:deoxyguanosinetriphosphate triphosphohydrolase [Candidatus Paceibacter sp.]
MKYAHLVDEANANRRCLIYAQTKLCRRRYPARDHETLIVDNAFEADEAKLLSSKAYRQLKDKTQVATTALTPLIRYRNTHVAEVQAVSVILSNALGLNTSLVRAIAIGHDIGHVPLGHQGEKFLAEAMGKPDDFCHEKMGVIVAQKIERRGHGLNLTYETLQGMMRHSGNMAIADMTQEAWLVRFTDKFAYIFADYNDITERMGFPPSPELVDLINEFGSNQRERTTTAMAALIVESAEAGSVSFQHSEVAQKFDRLRTLMYDLYGRATTQDASPILEPVLNFLTKLKIGDPFMLLALMTDKDVLYLSSQKMLDMSHIKLTSIAELLPHLGEIGKVDLCDPCLNW